MIYPENWGEDEPHDFDDFVCLIFGLSHQHYRHDNFWYDLRAHQNDTPWKINMEPEKIPLEKENQLPNHHFQFLC